MSDEDKKSYDSKNPDGKDPLDDTEQYAEEDYGDEDDYDDEGIYVDEHGNVVNADDDPDQEGEEGEEGEGKEGEPRVRHEAFRDDSVQGFFEHEEEEKECTVFTVSISPSDQNLVLSGDQNDKAFLWNLSTGEKLFELIGHCDSVVASGFSYDGKFAATGSMDGTVRVWNPTDGSLVQSLEGPASEIEWLQWHPRGDVVLAGSSDGTAWMWNAELGVCMQVFAGHLGPVLSGLFATGGKLVCTGSDDGSVYVWSPKTGQAKHHFKGAMFHDGPVTCMAAHPSRPLLLTGSQDTKAFLLSIDSGKEKVLSALPGHSDSVEAVSFANSEMQLAATASMDGDVIVWDLNTAQQRVKFRHDDGVVKVKWHPGSEALLYSCSLDQTVRLWDARSGHAVKEWHGHQAAVLDFAMTSDGHKVVSGGEDFICLVFETN